MIDLHLHSVNSDGTDTPEELVRKAVAAGVSAIALTDHDNLGGVETFLAACRESRITGIAGVEISAEVSEGQGSMHILGYGVDPRHPAVAENLDRILDGRAWRNGQILEKLGGLGMKLAWPEIKAYAGLNVVGRPHIAQAMVEREYVGSVKEAFDHYLAKGCPAYVDRFRMYPEEAIGMIRAAGGVAVLAHPFSWKPYERDLEIGLRDLKSLGLAGIEAFYSEYDPGQTVALMRLAFKLALLTTGGSDYHGLSKPGISIGKGFGRLHVPDSCLPPLLEALGKDNQWVAGVSPREG
ncbi:MAG: PHP domain-containing protein [Kiritimatiellae bacterium]|nr:PHP domain-containing protein [Kiritimatiellia bacterium]